MKSFASYLMLMFMVMFWVFRIMVAVMYTFGLEFIVEPINMNIEVILLFVVLACMLLVLKRKIIGGLAYLIVHACYYGPGLYTSIMSIIQGKVITMTDYTNVFISFIAVILAVAVFFELLLDKNRKKHPVDKKTDWFYKNEEYDRKLDERADKNNYRTL